ncbi:MAG: 3-phosphoserine/phosphohydroxythreonine transaminase [Planctomycetia bacterium]|nr:3-phosphoserine/phosphohydroxythreonine transaminase [Planctomycetia bacterium]
MKNHVYNFSAGPAVLPEEALKKAQENLLGLPGVGMSVLEISHRSKPFAEIIEAAEMNIRKLMNIPENYRVMFLQGGALLQFAMLPMNLLGGKSADYIITGTWSKKARSEAKLVGETRVIWDGGESNFNSLPTNEELRAAVNSDAAYVYYTSNETIQGVQFPTEPEVDVPLVCDASSEFFYKPINIQKYGCVYACAQKNCGPAGVTLVIMRDDFVARSPELPSLLNYKKLSAENSMLNTPPCFSIYMVKLVTDWLLNTVGGVEKMYEINKAKAALLYDVIDGSDGFYLGHAQKSCRSLMNVPFKMQTDALDKVFLEEAAKENLCSLAGHRSVGGFRASIYNAMPVQGVECLASFMKNFMQKHG